LGTSSQILERGGEGGEKKGKLNHFGGKGGERGGNKSGGKKAGERH